LKQHSGIGIISSTSTSLVEPCKYLATYIGLEGLLSPYVFSDKSTTTSLPFRPAVIESRMPMSTRPKQGRNRCLQDPSGQIRLPAPPEEIIESSCPCDQHVPALLLVSLCIMQSRLQFRQLSETDRGRQSECLIDTTVFRGIW